MKSSKFFKTPKADFLQFSLQHRLPLFICCLLLIIIVIFGWTSYVGLKEAALATGRERLSTLTDQLSAMFQQSAQSIIITTRVAARQPEIKNYLLSNENKNDSETLKALQKLRTDSSSVSVELWTKNRVNVLTSGSRIPINIDSVLSISALHHDSAAVGKMYAIKDTVYYPIIALVSDNKQIIGYIVSWKVVHATPQALEQLSELIGTQAKLYFGNTDGKLWTDMIKAVPRPTICKK